MGTSKFMAYDWDEGKFVKLRGDDVVKAIHQAWNFEFDVYLVESEELIFSGREDNESNSEMLEPYGIRLIDHEGYRMLQDIKSGQIYKPDWQK